MAQNDTKSRFFVRLGLCVKELRRANETTQDVHSYTQRHDMADGVPRRLLAMA
jgi:hypothetical protein